MFISTMTSSFRSQRMSNVEHPYPECIARCKAAGFDILDLNMCSMDQPEKNSLCGDDWERKLDEIVEAADKYKVKFCQSHPPFRRGGVAKYENPDFEAFFQEMMRRSLIISSRLNIPWAVMHPVFDKHNPDLEAQLKINDIAFEPILDLAEQLGVGLAFENMIERPGGNKRFGSHAEELILLADHFNRPHVGFCWDFGHGNITVPDKQAEALRLLGSRLKAVHIADNLGELDDHFIPFQGNIQWEKLMPVLTEIGYEGGLVLEINLAHRMPEPLKDEANAFSASACRALLEMTKA